MKFKVYRKYFQILIILIGSLSGTTIAFAQKFAVGIKAGATFSKSSFGEKDDNDAFTNLWTPGFFGAALVNFPMKNNFSFQAEGGLSQRGRKIEFNEGTWKNVATYHFLDASMVLRKSYPLKWSKNVKGTWFFNIGPKVSYWMNGKGTVTAGGSYDYKVKFEKEPEEPDAPDFNTMYLSDVNRWLFGLDFGIGVDAPTLALQRFIIELRFTSGHTFYGQKYSAFNRTLGLTDNLRANEKIISLSVDYAINRVVNQGQKGKSTKKDVKSAKPRKNFDSNIH
jgi:Outer membrane protein beta-barrel domain